MSQASGVAADSCETITAETAKLLSRVSEVGDEDPFADIEEDEDELEESETVLDNCLEKLYATIHVHHTLLMCLTHFVAMAFVGGQHLFCTALPIVRRLLKGGVY